MSTVLTDGMDPRGLDFKRVGALNDLYAAEAQLSNALMSVLSQSASSQITHAIKAYASARARLEIIEMLNSEDFYVAMARSAAKVGDA